ncbi:alpha/beta fold hydrolase [Polyangium aurulentum]|uniref:alpha/beta fold hydrolase n=1 Tax=Polyangium aurulentum TaxID=2567896 RepID=UPI0010AE8A21|nr:alpha/beta hydrolase [Polyangium aurulentum]UQA62600.1 alpha/beta hydrolase [Polyangium aurulentum]
MFVRESGRGPAVLLLHGAPSSPDDFEALAERLAVSRRVLVPVMPGYLSEAMDEGTYTIARSVALIEEALVARGVSEVAAVGFSAGAYRAFALAFGGKVRVSTVVSLGGLAGYDEAGRQSMNAFATFIRSATSLQRPAMTGILLTRMLSPTGAASPEHAAQVAKWIDCVEPQALATELAGLATSEDFYPRLPELRIPVLARVGSLDMAVPPPLSERIVASVPGAKLEIVEGKGHALLIEDREATVESVARFLGV